MSFPRFFCQTPLAANQTIDLPEALTHHALRVLRLKNNSQITLFDGLGGQYNAKLLINGKHAQAQLDEKHTPERELAGEITLVQGLASGDKMDWIIEKATELGVARLLVVQAQRSVVRLSGERAQRRITHSQRIIESASEQCGRNHLMQLLMPLSLDEAIVQCDGLPMLACIPDARTRPLSHKSLLEPIRKQRGCALFIGPEGGWDPLEQTKLLTAGAMGTSLGSRVLRTETAGIAAVAALTALLDWDTPKTD